MFYAKSTGGFYSVEIHGDNIPADAVEITDNEHAALLEGQSSGKRIVAGDNGRPVLVDRPVPGPLPVSIPPVTPRQIRQALTRLNLRQQVEDAIAASDQDTKDWWEFGTDLERTHPVVATMCETLGVSGEAADALWALAYSL